MQTGLCQLLSPFQIGKAHAWVLTVGIPVSLYTLFLLLLRSHVQSWMDLQKL